MRKFWGAALCCLAALCQAQPGVGSGNTRLATLEWPPYVGAALPHEGLSTFVVQNVGSQLNWQPQLSYYPWTRAMKVGQGEAGFAGYFPAYFSAARDRSCYLSNSIGSSVIGFAYLKGSRFDWADLSELGGILIGTVQDYVNGEAFDNLVKAGKLKTDVAPSDVSNLRKLLAQRVQIAVVDKAVLRYLLATEPSLQPYKDQFMFHDKELASLSLHICFRRTPEGRTLQAQFNGALSKTSLQRLEAAYFAELDGK